MATGNYTYAKDTNWTINSDIYDIVEMLNENKQRFIEDENETTLALGIYGYITDTEAKKVQTSVTMTGMMGNEMFPARANLTKNVLAHAIYSNITDINAVPAHMTLNIGLKVEDFEKYHNNSRFIFDSDSPIFIGNYEFHFDYDIILIRSKTSANSYVYSAHYDMTEENRISNIIDPYLKQPFVIRIGNFDYIVFQTLVRQCSIEDTNDRIISDSIIENKTYTFDFANQIADFDVYVTDRGVTTRLTPVPYGSSTDGIKDYCWYIYITDNTIRITFDNKSYIPGLNCDIHIRAYTTLGEGGIFNYKKIDETSDGFFVDMSSNKDDDSYDKVTTFVIAATDSVDGMNRKTKAELQKLIPKAALSRGSITTETDVSNYFNLIDSETNRLIMQKKVDNQISRIWYSYFVLKDQDNNIIPTNSIMTQLITNDGSMKLAEDGRYVLPAGTIFKYDAKEKVAHVIDESEVPELFTDEYFGDTYYYMSVYNVILNPDPLYAAFYLTICNKNSFFTFSWVNESSDLQFIATNCNFKRNLLTDQQIYKFTFKMAQSVAEDFGLYYEEEVEEIDAGGDTIKNTIITNNMKCVIVLYRENSPYRWVEANLVDFSKNEYISSWELDLETDNGLDISNRIKINNLRVVGEEDSINYGYFDPNTAVKLYILAKFEDTEYGRYDLDDIAPGFFDDYSVLNIYDVEGGITFYENFTNILDTKVYAKDGVKNQFKVSGLPMVGLHYMTSEEYSTYLLDAMIEKKAYIDYCLILLENSMNVDFKFFNTYGPSIVYTIGDKERTNIGHTDITLKFRCSLKTASDIYTKDDLIAEIKEYIENLYGDEDWHAPNMITYLTNKFESKINFLEFMNYNDLRLGLQHILKDNTLEDPKIVPEFVNVRNRYNVNGDLEPCIDIEIVE